MEFLSPGQALDYLIENPGSVLVSVLKNKNYKDTNKIYYTIDRFDRICWFCCVENYELQLGNNQSFINHIFYKDEKLKHIIDLPIKPEDMTIDMYNNFKFFGNA